jgi:hypothetical protein
MGVLSGVILALFIASLIIVNLPATAGSLEPHTSIRCAWAPTCSAAHSLTVTSAADPKALRNATRLAEELREDERKLRVRHPQAGEFERRTLRLCKRFWFITLPSSSSISAAPRWRWSWSATRRRHSHLGSFSSASATGS